MRVEIKSSLNSQIVLELKNGRMIAQTLSKFAQSHGDYRDRYGRGNTLRTRLVTDLLRFALFFFGDCDGCLTRRTGCGRIVHW
jgi:hypothetical protein